MKKQFHNMNAETGTAEDYRIFRVRDMEGIEHYINPNSVVLKSYASIVCVIDDVDVYLLPRHDYSTTTSRQVSRFVNEWFGFNRSKREIKKEAVICKGYVTCVAGGFDEYKRY